jgi:tetratricopeptide (TPR) repeat protein
MKPRNQNIGEHCRLRGQRRVLNPVAAAICAGLSLLFLGGMRFLHSRNSDITSDFLRASAWSSLDAGDYSRASVRLMRYIAAQPGDREAQLRLSEALSEHVQTTEALEHAFRLNEDLLRADRTQVDLRLRQVRLAVRLRQFSAAASHLSILRSELPDSSEVFFYSGRVADAMRLQADAVAYLERAINLPQPVPEAFALLAALTDQQSRNAEAARTLMNRMVSSSPTPEAWRIRGEWYLRQGDVEAATADVWRALDQQPGDQATNALLIQCLLRQQGGFTDRNSAELTREVEQGLAHLRRMLEQQPQETFWYACLAQLQAAVHQTEEAIITLEHGIHSVSQHEQLRRLLIELVLDQGDTRRADQMLQGEETAEFSQATRRFLAARLCMLRGQWQKAVQDLDLAIINGGLDTDLQLRVHLCQAICRQRLGDSRGALELYRDLVTTRPDSTAAQLGLAAAFWQTDQKGLAVAAWRQLVHVPGVAASLADLLIRHNLTRPASARDWSEATRLIEAIPPLIDDPLERMLLQADLQFALGKPGAGCQTLELARVRYPDRAEFARALKYLRTTHSVHMLQRLKTAAAEDPEDVSTHVEIVQWHIAHDDLNQAAGWLQQLVNGQGTVPVTRGSGLQVAVACLRRVVAGQRQYGAARHVTQLREMAVGFASELFQSDPQQLPVLVAVLGEAGQSAEARDLLLEQVALPRQVRARGWLELVRFGSRAEGTAQTAIDSVVSTILEDPASVELRMLYADLLLYLERTDDALRVLQQVAQATHRPGIAAARVAWIRAIRGDTTAELAAAASMALRGDSQNEILSAIAARVNYEQGRCEDAVAQVARLRTAAGCVVEAAALLELGRTEAALATAYEAQRMAEEEPLLPADRTLLQQTLHELRGTGPAVTSMTPQQVFWNANRAGVNRNPPQLRSGNAVTSLLPNAGLQSAETQDQCRPMQSTIEMVRQ